MRDFREQERITAEYYEQERLTREYYEQKNIPCNQQGTTTKI